MFQFMNRFSAFRIMGAIAKRELRYKSALLFFSSALHILMASVELHLNGSKATYAIALNL